MWCKIFTTVDKIVLALFIFVNKVASECPRSPSPLGKFGFVSNCEVECALQCKAMHDCLAYQFMEFRHFQTPGNSLESNCVLQTAWDLDFVAEEMIDQNLYGFNKPKVEYVNLI